jgi:hypothetical protein
MFYTKEIMNITELHVNVTTKHFQYNFLFIIAPDLQRLVATYAVIAPSGKAVFWCSRQMSSLLLLLINKGLHFGKYATSPNIRASLYGIESCGEGQIFKIISNERSAWADHIGSYCFHECVFECIK